VGQGKKTASTSLEALAPHNPTVYDTLQNKDGFGSFTALTPNILCMMQAAPIHVTSTEVAAAEEQQQVCRSYTLLTMTSCLFDLLSVYTS
jgi:hypothetical protein